MSAVECPKCHRQWSQPKSEQAACIELYGECIPCRFMPPNDKGTDDDLVRITELREKWLAEGD